MNENTGNSNDQRVRLDQWNLFCSDWKHMTDRPNDAMARRLFHNSIADESEFFIEGLPEGVTYSDMPYGFWLNILIYCFNPETIQTIIRGLPSEYIQHHFIVLKKWKEESDDENVSQHLQYISAREDDYKDVPVKWLETMYL